MGNRLRGIPEENTIYCLQFEMSEDIHQPGRREYRMKKRLFLTFGSIAAAGLLGACSSGTTTQSTQTQAAGEATTQSAEASIKGEVRYAFWDKKQEPWLQKCIEEFNKTYPDVTIKLEQSSWDEYWTKLEAGATGGSSADVFWLNGPNITKYARGGVLLPIDDLLKNSDINTANYPEALVKLYNVDGKQYAIPKDFDTIGVWYNKELFDAAGVPYPTNDWTWEDMAAMAKQLTKTDGSVYGITAAYRDQTGFYNTVFAHGGYVVSDDKKSSGYDKAETQAGVQCWADLQAAGVSPSQASLEETEDYVRFLSGSVAMHWNGSWFVNEIIDSDLKDKVGVVALPSINGKKATVIHGLGNCIAKSTKNPEAAWKWVEFLASEKANQLSAETGAAIPAYKGTATQWVDAHKEYDLNVFIEAAEQYSYPYPVSQNAPEWGQYQTDILKKVFSLESDAKAACEELAVKMNEVLKNEQ